MAETQPRSSDFSRLPLTDEPAGGQMGEVFVSDPSAEAEGAAGALRAAGYRVFDVPLQTLASRVARYCPSIVLIDVDAEGAREVVGQMREMPGGDGVEVLFIGQVGRTLRNTTEAIVAGGSAFFARPLDVGALVKTVQVLAPIEAPLAPRRSPSWSSLPPASGPALDDSSEERARTSTGEHPSTIPPAPPAGFAQEAELAATERARVEAPPASVATALLDAPLDQGSWGLGPASLGTVLSDELQRLLASAEERVGASLRNSSQPPSPEEEVDAVLPAELLAALDEPLDYEDDEELNSNLWPLGTPGRGGTTTATRKGATPSGGATTGGARATQIDSAVVAVAVERSSAAQAEFETEGGWPRSLVEADVSPMRAEVTGAIFDNDNEERITPRPAALGRLLPPPESEPRPEPFVHSQGERALLLYEDIDDAPPTRAAKPTMAPPAREGFSIAIERPEPVQTATVAPAEDPAFVREYVTEPRGSAPAASQVIAEPPRPPKVLGEGEATTVLAMAVAERYTGSLCFDGEGGLRRVVLRDGDLVTAGSSLDDETLVAFLVARGELPKDVARRLSARLPPFGRHAGAALVAHGHIGQDRLWEVLRGHAEWVVGKVLQLSAGTCVYEDEPPGRLRAEPSVFGGSTGAEVVVEVVRRVVSPQAALARLGGPQARLGDGRRRTLLGECALANHEIELVERSRGGTLAEAVEWAESPDFAAVLLALRELGVVETLASIERATPELAPERDALDDEALRARVRARLDLVEEGDYFAVLGVARTGTPYEIKRAFLELRRSFEPSRVLTAATADLAPSLRLILEVLDEAYEVLRDATRRERYRRAIEAGPPEA